MNPRLSLQGRASLDGWGGGTSTSDHNALPGAATGRSVHHRRNSSLYRNQQHPEIIFNAYDGPGGLAGGESVGLRELREVEESDDDEDDDADERTQLRNTSVNGHPKSKPKSPTSRSLSHSPVPRDSSLGDVRLNSRS